jgi:predicted amidohydrolase
LELQDLAKELGVWIVVGIHELPGEDDDEKVKEESRNGKKVFNTYVAIGPTGSIEKRYRKVSGSVFIPEL